MALDDLQSRRKTPLQRGVDAGKQAYSGTPQRSGIAAIPVANVKSSVERAIEQAAAQRQALASAAAKQTAGGYGNTGTSAAAYDYLRGKPEAKYPVNPVLAGQPGSAITSPTVQRPYEQATRPGTTTQTQTSKTAKEQPSGMGTRSALPQMPQQGPLGQLLELAMPAYLGYKGYQYLTNAFPGGYTYDAISKYFGSPAAAATTDLGGGVQALLDSAYSGPSAVIADATTGSGLEYLADAGAGAGAAGVLPELGAGQVGYVWDGTSMIPATAEQIAEASSIGQWTGTAADAALGETITASALNTGEVSSLAEMAGWAPWLAAGALAFSDAGQQAIDRVASGVSDVVGGIGQPIAEGIGDLLGTVGGWFGIDLAEGGQVSGIAALPQRYNLGGYSDGGRLLKGPGDGVSDSIPATIGAQKQPARLADGEFVVPARIVSELGNGSTDAGARKLYAMMDRVQRARSKTTGKDAVAKNTRADKYLPA